jgi:hypothetical protein
MGGIPLAGDGIHRNGKRRIISLEYPPVFCIAYFSKRNSSPSRELCLLKHTKQLAVE